MQQALLHAPKMSLQTGAHTGVVILDESDVTLALFI